MAFDWTPFAVGGATRPDSFSGMHPAFQEALSQLFAAAPENIRGNLRVGSGFRSPERQAQLWSEAVKKYGSPEAARKWVAPPGRSQHNHGHAADLKYLNDDARAWAHENAPRFGLSFPLSNESWHIELAGARGGRKPDVIGEVMAAAPASGPKGQEVFGGVPTQVAAATPSVPAPTNTAAVPAAVQATATSGKKAGLGDIFGMMALAQQQGPKFSPVQIMGPSAEQASGLSQLVQALKNRMV